MLELAAPKETDMLRALRIALVVIAAGSLCGLAAQDKNSDQPKSEWITPAIQGYG